MSKTFTYISCIIGLIVFSLIIFLGVRGNTYLNKAVEKRNERIAKEYNHARSFLGDTLVIFSDTLLISTYEYNKKRFGLSNGSFIDQEIIFKEKEQKKHE